MTKLDYEPPKSSGPNPKAFIRLVLTLSSVVMIVFAGLTLSGVLGLQPMIGWLFFAVAVIDLLIGYLVFKD
jgi:hypothetical protein